MKKAAIRNSQDDHNGAVEAGAVGIPGVPGIWEISQLLEIQRDLAIGLLSCASLRECLDLLLVAALRLPGFDCGAIYLCDEATGGLRLIAHSGLTDGFVKEVSSYPADSPQARMVRAGKSVYAMLTDFSPEIGDFIAAEGLEALAVLPMFDGGQVIGSVNVSSRRYPQIGESSRVALESLVAQAEGAITAIRAREARDLAKRRLRLEAIEARDQLEIRVAQRTAELEAANAALRESNELLTEFMRCSPIYSFVKIVTADESRVLIASENYREMIGVPGSCMVGKTMHELFPAELAAKIIADDWAVVSRGAMLKVDEEMNGRNYVTLKFPIIQGDRTLLAGYTMDVTDRVLSERTMKEWNQTLERRVAERTAELNQSEARFRQLAEATFEGIAVTENGILLDGNPQLAEIHGYELPEMIGRPVMDFIAPESRALVAKRIREGYGEAYECYGLRKDGSTFPAEVHACMRIWHGNRTRVTALRDMTKEKQAAARLQAQQTELEHAQRLGLVSEVSAGIIHQVGQPLGGMGANLAAVQANVGACDRQTCGTLEIINDVNADVERLRKIVTHLRSLANPGRANRARFDFNAMVLDVLRLLGSEAGRRSMEIQTDLCLDLPEVDGDAVQLSQVVLNLVRNGFDACAESPPELRRVGLVTRLVDGGCRLELSVRDSGAGIAPEVMENLFAPFFTTKAEGIGMGLRLSQTIVHAHGGTIDGFNNPDRIGATFRVTLSVNSNADYTKV